MSARNRRFLKSIAAFAHQRVTKRAFTLIELLVVVAVVMVLAAVIIASLQTSRARAEDTKTKEVLGSVRIAAAEQKTETGSFDAICDRGKAHDTMATLAQQQKLTPTEYTCVDSIEEFAVVFPLKSTNGFFCVDALGNIRVVATPIFPGEPYRCSSLPAQTQQTPSGNGIPVITLASVSEMATPNTIQEPTYSAYDREDGDITARVTYTDQRYDPNPRLYCTQWRVRRTYSVSDSSGNTATAERTLWSDTWRECPAPPVCEQVGNTWDDIPPCGAGGIGPG